MTKIKKIGAAILLAAAVTAVILLMPMMIRHLQAANRAPDHTVTYKDGKLIWDNGTAVDASGGAELNLFSAAYPKNGKAVVKSADGRKVIAPGTSGECLVRLVNGSSQGMRYTLKSTKELDQIPMTLTFNEKTDLNESDTLRAGGSTDVLIAWNWPFHVSDKQDAIDTQIGNKGAEAKVGLVINAEDLPAANTGITGSNALPLIGIIVVLAAGLIGLLIYKRKRGKR